MTTPDEEETPMRSVQVTCHTETCGNAEHPIDLIVPDEPEPYVMCGVCGIQITDVQGIEAVPTTTDGSTDDE